MDFSIRKNNNYVLVLSVVLMAAVLFARDLYGVNISRTLLIALSVFPAVVMNYESLVYYVFFLFSLTSGIPGNYIFPLLIMMIMIKKHSSFNRNGIVFFVIVVFMEIIHFAFYSFHISWSGTVGYFSNLFFLFYFVSLNDDSVDINKCIIYFCLGLAVFLLAIFYITQINGDFEMLLDDSGRLGYTKSISDAEDGVMMLNANPNGLGFFAVVGLSAVIVLYTRKSISFVVMLALSALYLFVGALGVSRTFLFAVIVMLVLFLIFAGLDLGKAPLGRYFLLLVAALVALFVLSNTSFIHNAYINRLSANMGTMGSRTTVFVEYNDYLFNHPLYLFLGTGAVHYRDVISDISVSSHNGLQQILVSYGLVGLLFFLYITVKAIHFCYKKGSPVCLVPFLIAFLYVQTGQLLSPPTNLYLFIVSFFVMKLSKESASKT